MATHARFKDEEDDENDSVTDTAELHKKRPESPDRLGQVWWRDVRLREQAPNRRFGFERLGHMHSIGIPFKFEELQGRHPFDFITETKEHFKEVPRPAEERHQVRLEDLTVVPKSEWMEPLRKGQAYWDYCRDKWMSKVSQLGAAVGPSTSIYSLWSITDLCLEHGGFAFMLICFIMTILFTIPIIYMELAVGQFHRHGVVKTMKQVCPLLLGVGYLMISLCFVDYLFSLTRITWLFFYIYSSFRSDFPWTSCDNPWNSKFCKATNNTSPNNTSSVIYKESERTPVVDFFRFNVLRHVHFKHGVNGTQEFNILEIHPNLGVFLCFLTLLPFLHYRSKQRCQALGRNMYFTYQFAFILILLSYLILFYADRDRHVHMPEHEEIEGVITNEAYHWFFDLDNLKFLTKPTAWVAAFQHVAISSGIGTGIFITSGSHNPFVNYEIKFNAVVSCVASYVVHFIVAMFFITCHFTLRATESFKNNRHAYGKDTILEIFPQVVNQLEPTHGYSWIVLVGMLGGLLLFSVLRVYCCLHTIQQYFCDKDKAYYESFRKDFNFWESKRSLRQKRCTQYMLSSQRRGTLMWKIVILVGIVQSFSFFPRIEFSFALVEGLWYKYLPPLVLLLECLVIFFFLGVRTLNSYIRKMTTWPVTIWYRFVWKSFTPVFPILYFIHFHPLIVPTRYGPVVYSHTLAELENPTIYYNYYCYAICLGLPLVFLAIQVFCVFKQAPCQTLKDSLLLESTPEHDQASAILGIKPLTRFHWMHHMAVPSGISRGECRQSNDPNKYPVSRFHSPFLDKWVWNVIWRKLGLSSLNDIRFCAPRVQQVTEPAPRKTVMFPSKRLQLKAEKKGPSPEHLPDKQIEHVLKLKTEKAQEYRKMWLGAGNDEIDPATGKKKGTLRSRLHRSKFGHHHHHHAHHHDDASDEDSSTEDELSDDEVYTSEYEEGEISDDYEHSPYEDSIDDDESMDWEYFSDNSIYSTDSLEGGRISRRLTNRNLSRRHMAEESESDGEEEYDEKTWRLREIKYFKDYTIDELDEFEDVMDEDGYVGPKHQPKEFEGTSETDTEEPSDSVVSWHHDEIKLADDDFVISDDDVFKGVKSKTGKGKGSDQGSSENDDSWSSCSSSCGSGSSWSSRSSGQSLAEEPAVIVSKGNALDKLLAVGAVGTFDKGQTHTSLTTKPKQDLIKDKYNQRGDRNAPPPPLEAKQSVHGPFNIQGGVVRTTTMVSKNFFNDVKRRLQNFLSVNITPRHGHGHRSKTEHRDSIESLEKA